MGTLRGFRSVVLTFLLAVPGQSWAAGNCHISKNPVTDVTTYSDGTVIVKTELVVARDLDSLARVLDPQNLDATNLLSGKACNSSFQRAAAYHEEGPDNWVPNKRPYKSGSKWSGTLLVDYNQDHEEVDLGTSLSAMLEVKPPSGSTVDWGYEYSLRKSYGGDASYLSRHGSFIGEIDVLAGHMYAQRMDDKVKLTWFQQIRLSEWKNTQYGFSVDANAYAKIILMRAGDSLGQMVCCQISDDIP